MTQKYFFCRKVYSKWQEGSTVSYFREDGQTDVYGIVLKNEPLKLLSSTREVESDKTPREHLTRVDFELKPINSIVKLTLWHADLVSADYVDNDDMFAGLNNGWTAILSNLKSLLKMDLF